MPTPVYNYKVLGQICPSSTSVVDAYQVPNGGQSVISSVQVCNQTASAVTFRISASVAGAADGATQYLFYDYSIDANSSKTIKLGWTLGSKDIIRVKSGTASALSFNIVGIYDSASESLSGLLTGLVAYWRMDESTGSTIYDVAGNERNFAAQNSPTFAASGKINNGVTFTRTSSQYASVAHSSVWEPAAFTISCWLKRNSTGNHHIAFAHDDSVVGYAYYINQADNKMHLVHQGVADKASNTALSTATWYHTVVTYASGTYTFYLNGSSDGSGALSTYATSSTTLLIGANKSAGSPQLYFDGTLDEIGFWSRALSGAEITSLYNSGSGLSYPF